MSVEVDDDKSSWDVTCSYGEGGQPVNPEQLLFWVPVFVDTRRIHVNQLDKENVSCNHAPNSHGPETEFHIKATYSAGRVSDC